MSFDQVYTHWSEWGECNQCDKSGRRLKFGTCMVQKIDKDAVITPTDVPIMNLYPSGVPCRSTVLIRKVAHLKGIRGRKSEVITGNVNYSLSPTLYNSTDLANLFKA